MTNDTAAAAERELIEAPVAYAAVRGPVDNEQIVALARTHSEAAKGDGWLDARVIPLYDRPPTDEGDVASQARAWRQVYRAMKESGLDQHTTDLSGRGRALEFLAYLTAQLTAANKRLAEVEGERNLLKAEVAKHVESVAPELSSDRSCVWVEGFGSVELDWKGRLAQFDDPTPLTPELVMKRLPANCTYSGGETSPHGIYEIPSGERVIEWTKYPTEEFHFYLGGELVPLGGFTLGDLNKLIAALRIEVRP